MKFEVEQMGEVMKKLIMIIGVLVVFAASSMAASPTTKAGEFDGSVKALIEEGFTVEEAETTVAQIVAKAREDGLSGEEISQRLDAVVKAVKAIKESAASAPDSDNVTDEK